MSRIKALSIVISFVLLIAVLASCGAGGAQQQSSAASSQAATQDAKDETSAAVSESSKTEGKVIGVSLFYKRDEYYKDMESALLKYAKDEGFKLLIQDADADPAKQTSQFESFIASKVDMIIFAPTDPKGMIPSVEAANKTNIPVIAFDAATTGGKLESVVILDNFKAGEEMGKWAKDYIEKNLDGKANIAILDFPIATLSCVPRVEGFKSIIKDMPGIKIVAQQDGKASRTNSMSVFENILTANSDIDLVFSINDDTSFGAIAAAETKGKNNIVFSL